MRNVTARKILLVASLSATAVITACQNAMSAPHREECRSGWIVGAGKDSTCAD